jgi:hypothetical protein
MVRWMFFWPLIYWPALIGGGFALWRWRGARIALIVPFALLSVHMLSTPWMRTHYLAPIVPLWILFVVYAIRAMARVKLPTLRWRPPRLLPATVAIGLIIGSTVYSIHTNVLTATLLREKTNGRQTVIDATRRVPGQHIIFVFYTLGPQDHYEWVYNGAELDEQDVIWAHMREPEQDMELVNHYPDRSVWMLTVSNDEFHLRAVALRAEPRPAP